MGKKYAIIHDSLAKEIAQKASVKTRRFRQIKAVLKQSIERNKLLDKSDLQEIKVLQQDFALSEKELILIQKSKQQILLKFIVIAITIFTILAITAFALWFRWQSNQEAQRAEARRLAFIARQELNQKNATTALRLTALANQYQESPIVSTVLSDAFHQNYNGIPFLLKQLQLPPSTKQVEFISDTTLLSLSENGQLNQLNLEGKIIKEIGSFPQVNSFEIGQQQVLLPNGNAILVMDFLGTLTATINLPAQQKVKSIFAIPFADEYGLITQAGQFLFYPNQQAVNPISFPYHFQETETIQALHFSKVDTSIMLWGKTNTAYGVAAFLYKWHPADSTFEQLDIFPFETKDMFILNQNSIVDIEKGWAYSLTGEEEFMESQTRLTKIANNQKGILSTNSDNEIKWWSPQGQLIAYLKQSESTLNNIAISQTGTSFLSLSEIGILNIWSLKHPLLQEIKTIAPIISMETNPERKEILLALADTSIQLLHFDEKISQVFKGHQAAIKGAIFLHEEHLLSYGADNIAIIWKRNGAKVTNLKGHQDEVNFATFNAKKTLIATCSKDQTVRLWDSQGNCLDTLPHPDFIDFATFSSDGYRLLTTCRDNQPRLWKNGKESVFAGHDSTYQYSVLHAVFSPDEQTILSASGEGNSILWDLNGQIRQQFSGHSYWVNAVQFAPNEAKMITASQDKTAALWNLDGTLITSLLGHTDGVKAANFSKNGQHLLTYSTDGTAKLWNLRGELLANYWHNAPIVNAYFLPNNRILTASKDGQIRFWLSPTGILDYLTKNPLPEFLDRERRKYALEKDGIH